MLHFYTIMTNKPLTKPLKKKHLEQKYYSGYNDTTQVLVPECEQQQMFTVVVFQNNSTNKIKTAALSANICTKKIEAISKCIKTKSTLERVKL